MKGALTPKSVDKKFTVLSRIKEAMIDELVALGALDPVIAKTAAVTDEQAVQSMNRLENIQKSKPTGRQVGRYATLGAIAGPAIHATGALIKGKGVGGILEGATHGAKLRDLASISAKGAIGMGAVPLVRTGLDQRAETTRLKQYMREQQPMMEPNNA